MPDSAEKEKDLATVWRLIHDCQVAEFSTNISMSDLAVRMSKVLKDMRDEANAAVGAAVEACAKHIKNYKFLCEENERAYASAKRIFSQALLDLFPSATGELERIKAEARLDEQEHHNCVTPKAWRERIAELSAQEKETR